ncbi:Ribosome-recycling factor, mitochondrial [Caenorhabditis elegans]|uniref:Ribosome-recycling factor, mitochondrial n=1 Tax=Caenorhabditis elegans TaxID=6239 RepID=RRFM_CAEEL|nr:Ribosome-recycling factor, mitochondrial [Caenorhabditis elegans]P91478.2 RecName: Full=Ribosome-recycling factor, mitochondrial; Short=RRF; AltName: Full=Ribosome-releasing factor, mitochondrial; Flags: Precursor [Caenorhabditis elegans]CCD67783.1 Ribosome-recycling factor, mitochondrial [Caenorhabditis elegans]|eukprot:NP_491262.2 Ribosome-recycling factor, mitochondrial [Caenorhabditis elegans]
MIRLAVIRLAQGASRAQFLQKQAQIFTSAVVNAKKKADNKKKNPPAVFSNLEENAVVQETIKEIQRVEGLLVEELTRHFSLKVDIRQYEDVMVKLENGKDKPLSMIARVTLKSPLMIMINFQDNPSAIKAAKLAIQKSTLNVTPQQEGAVLYVNVPPMSKERREKMASDAKGRILNEYKKAINEIYSKSDKKSSNEFSTRPDEAKKTREALLNMKHAAEQRGGLLIEERRKQLLKQVV